MTRIFKTIDLFAGIGGIRIGFETTGHFKTVFANDFEPACKFTYDLNFSDSKLMIDDIRNIKSVDLPDFDILLAGFPCQAFSIAGRRQGFDDEKGRGNLFFEIERILKDKQPKAFLLENVKNLESHDRGNTFQVIINILDQLGYYSKHKVLNSMDYGNIPQNRERIYIVGFKDINSANKFKFPEKIGRKVEIKDILYPINYVEEKYYYNDKPLYERIVNEVTEENNAYQWRRKYVRKNKKGVFPTLTANMGMGGHNVPIIKQGEIIRKITPKECSLVQGFPESYKIPVKIADSHLYKQFGNSVSVPVVHRIAKEMYSALTI